MQEPVSRHVSSGAAPSPAAPASSAAAIAYDAVLVVSFGGPEGPADVVPFLENVLRGKPVPRERLLEVAEHYRHFGGVSPLNGQNRALVAALERELAEHGPRLPVYWGNRNWHPLLADTLARMAADGVRRALAYVTSAYSSYSGCRQYLENIAAARQAVGPQAPIVDKLRVFYNHPGFIEPLAELLSAGLSQVPDDVRPAVPVVYTAHSIPLSMAENCRYATQLRETARLVSAAVGRTDWTLVYQSRSGPPGQPWLEPDIKDHLTRLAAVGTCRHVVVVPIGFLSDHMEVVFDLDTEARAHAEALGLEMIRVATVGHHPTFVRTLRDLIAERAHPGAVRPAVGPDGPSHDVCPADCCLPATRTPAKAEA